MTQQAKKRIYYFRLSACNTEVIKEALEKAIKYQQENHNLKMLGSILVELGLITEDELKRAIIFMTNKSGANFK